MAKQTTTTPATAPTTPETTTASIPTPNAANTYGGESNPTNQLPPTPKETAPEQTVPVMGGEGSAIVVQTTLSLGLQLAMIREQIDLKLASDVTRKQIALMHLDIVQEVIEQVEAEEVVD